MVIKFDLVLLLLSPQIKAEDDQPLPGVLLSLSGGVFRSNLLTQDNGVLTFSNLVRLWSTAEVCSSQHEDRCQCGMVRALTADGPCGLGHALVIQAV